MVRNVAGFLIWLASLMGLPFLAWWISTLFLQNPPLVAPFLLASPFYAMYVAGAIISRGLFRKREEKMTPIEPTEIAAALQDRELLARYVGKIGLISDEDLSSGAIVSGGWILIDQKLWKNLGPEARAFMLIRTATNAPGRWWSFPVRLIAFLVAYLLACVNLWFVIVLHVGFAASCAIYAARRVGTYDEDRDRVALAISANYEGARQYLTTIKLEGDRRKVRLAALKRSAVELGFV